MNQMWSFSFKYPTFLTHIKVNGVVLCGAEDYFHWVEIQYFSLFLASVERYTNPNICKKCIRKLPLPIEEKEVEIITDWPPSHVDPWP